MDDLLLQLLLTLAEVFLEALLELGGEAVMDLFTRAATDVFKPSAPQQPARSFISLLILGAMAGAGSAVIVPHPLFPRSRFHGISLVLSPLVTGAVMAMVGNVLRRRGKRVVPVESFPYAFAFAFGMALLRFLLTR